MSRKKLLLAAGLAGVAVAGGLAAKRRRAPVSLPTHEGHPLPSGGRSRTVVADDGVELFVEEHGPADAAATFVLAHGYCLTSETWLRQLGAITDARPDLRVVIYDQRGHGRSARTSAERATLQQLGRDLARILDEVAPEGPVVAAGHSMGGMTIMSLAEQHPELFGDRVVGVGLVATSAGNLHELTYGLPWPLSRITHRLLPVINETNRRREAQGKERLPVAVMKRLLFGVDADPNDVRRVLEILTECPADTVADFHATFGDHDRREALAAMRDLDVTILIGDRDQLCPIAHSRTMARELPEAHLVVFPGAGHMLSYERTEEVSRQLVALADRVVPKRQLTA